MGKTRPWKSILTLAALALSVSAFTGQERYIELEGFLNGRSSSSFRAQDRNVRAVLQKGTRGEILETKLLPSGNYGVLVKTLNGAHSGQSFWVYYKKSQPALKIYQTAPPSWGLGNTETRAAETTRDVGVYRDPSAVENAKIPVPEERPTDQVQAADGNVPVDAKDAMSAIDRANEVLKGANSDPISDCAECVDIAKVPIPKDRPPYTPQRETIQTRLLRDTSKQGFHNACYQIIKKDGSYGERGEVMASIMKEPRYKEAFTKRSSLGSFCPKFNALSEDQKIQAWAWFWTSLGSEESGCELNKYHPKKYKDRRGRWRVLNPNEGWGIWTAEKDRNLREDRGPACDNIKTFEGQARCAIDTMYQKQVGRLGQNASLAIFKYWGPTYNHRKDRQMMPHMERFTACF